MTISRTAAIVAAGLACVCAPAAAQDFPSLALGQTVQGALQAGDPVGQHGGPFRVYQVQVEAGRRYEARMDAMDFDPIVHLMHPVGGITELLQTDDDGGEGTNARLRFEVPRSGTYLLVAQSLSPDGLGAFTLALDTVRIVIPDAPPVGVGQTVRGELTGDDMPFEFVEGYYDLYRLDAPAGSRLRITLSSSEYIPVFMVGMLEEDEFTPFYYSDEETGGAVMNLRVADDQPLFIQAGAEGDAAGPYTLAVEARPPAPAPTSVPVARGQRVSGTLEPGDAELEDGRFFDQYVFTGRAGESLRLELNAPEADPLLMFGRMVNGEFVEIESNDDDPQGEGLDSALDLTLSEDGEYVIRATTFMEGGQGAYELVVGA